MAREALKMRRLFVLLALIAFVVIPAYASFDYGEKEILPGGGSAVIGTSQLMTYNPQNLTEPFSFTLTGRNMTVTNNGIYDYDVQSASCDLQAYHVALATFQNYSFDVHMEWETETRKSYNSNFTLSYDIDNLQTWNLSQLSTGYGGFNLRGVCDHGVIYAYANSVVTPPSKTITYPNDYGLFSVGSANAYWAPGYYNMISPTPPAVPSPSYDCNFDLDYPYQQSPFGAICWDTTDAYPAIDTRNWTITQPDTTTYTTGNETLVRTLTQDGWYGLDFEACNALGCGYTNTSTWLNLSATPPIQTGISFWVHNYDPVRAAKIGPSTVGIYNTTWRNISTNTGSVKFSSTDFAGLEKLTSGQAVTLIGSATGYTTTMANITIPYDGWEYYLNLPATGEAPLGTNATLFVNAINSYTAGGLEGVTVTISNATIPYSSSKLTNSGGVATFSNIQAGQYQISASKTGYQSSVTSWVAPASTVTNAYIGLLPVGATPVVTSAGGDPIYDASGNPIIGYDLSGNPITASPTQDYRTNDEKAEGMMDIFYDNGEGLIMLFILFTIMYMLKGIVW